MDMPTLKSLQCLESVSRLGSLAQASQQLNLSQSAISRQIKSVEQLLNTPVLVASGRGVTLSAAGEQLLADVRPAIAIIEQSCRQIRERASGQMLVRLATPPTFGAVLMIPLLAKLRALRADVVVTLESYIGRLDQAPDALDLLIHYQKQPPENAYFLFDECLVAVCSPALRGQPLFEQSLLQLRSRPSMWADWMDSALPPSVHWGATYEHFPMLLHAAKSGLGAALLPRFVCHSAIEAGELVALTEPKVVSGHGYYLSKRSSMPSPTSDWLAEWIVAELKSGWAAIAQ